jgi:hypothetical protein
MLSVPDTVRGEIGGVGKKSRNTVNIYEEFTRHPGTAPG